MPDNLAAQPRKDREEPLVEGANIVYDRYSGEVACYRPGGGGSMIRETMKHGGFDATRNAHKYRCPFGACAATSCAAFASCSAGLAGRHGRQVRVSPETDWRRFAPVYPRTKRWQRLYNGRSAVERINAYLKDVMPLERHCVRGRSAIELRVLMASLTLNLRALICLRAKQATLEAA